MLVPASNIARMGFGPAANKQAMMGCVQTRGMGHRASGDWPLGDHGAFFEINYRNMADPSHNISHSDVQSFSGRLDCDASRITAGEFNAAHQFGRLCVDYVDRSIGRPVLTAATKVFKDLDAGINQMGSSIVRSVIRSPVRISVSRQLDCLDDLVSSPTNGYHGAICQGHPDFVGFGKIECLFGHS